MPYDPDLVQPMREELTRLGVAELTTPEAVDAFLDGGEGTALIFFNSVCGCAAGSARPGLGLALQHGDAPARTATVFAGQDADAVARVRDRFPFPASSPAAIALKDGVAVDFVPRQDIEGRPPEQVRDRLVAAFARFRD